MCVWGNEEYMTWNCVLLSNTVQSNVQWTGKNLVLNTTAYEQNKRTENLFYERKPHM